MILYIKNEEKCYSNFGCNKMDLHPFSLACVFYIIFDIRLKIEIKILRKISVDFNIRDEMDVI